MRLLHIQDDGSLAYTEFKKHKIPPYAILSHTWGDGEVTFQDLVHGTLTELNGYRKIFFCGEQAAKHGLKYFWVDTCCIDKQNLPELTKAINSMFRWYRNATKCYAYLSDISVATTEDLEEMSWKKSFEESRWFTRGWTLQELVAPKAVEFYSAAGHFLGTKQTLEVEISEITGISVGALRGQPLSNFSVAERFEWAANRETTEEEDIAYCLLGIFDVFMPLIPGEGESSALRRLEKAVNEPRDLNLLRDIEATEYRTSLDLASSDIPADSDALDDIHEISREERRRRRVFASLRGFSKIGPLALKPRRIRRKIPLSLNLWSQALCLSLDAAKDLDGRQIFQNAQSSFLHTVFWDEWPAFDTVPNRFEMMADLRSICGTARHSSRLLSACKDIEAFSVKWANFFTLAESAIEIDPEWISTAWTAIRLTFMRCKNFVSMFEKLAHMLELIMHQLPNYGEHILQPFHDYPEDYKIQLSKALGFVYADILQFCQDACAIFKKSPIDPDTGRDPVIALLSAPFNARFKYLLDRLSEHKRLLDIDLAEKKYRSLTNFMANVILALEDREQIKQEKNEMRRLEEEKRTRDRTIHDSIPNWIQPPEFSADFNRAKEARTPGSCAWLQSESSYVAWKAALQAANLESKTHGSPHVQHVPPILLFEGPAGYGKTVLSTTIIEDLANMTATDPTNPNDSLRNEVAYFYFNAQMPRKQSYCDALRGAVIQVVESLRSDSGLVDAISILMMHDDAVRPIASDAVLLELLMLSSGKFSSLALVLDGIEECRDFEEMWPLLSTVCTDNRIRCLCLGRPSVPIPRQHAHLVVRQSLLGLNRQDICDYLRDKIEHLRTTGDLEKHLVPDHTADALASRADSRFLWASLMISYLQSPALSPFDRTREIKDSTSIETLHGLYSKMLCQFESLFPQERTLLTRIFEVVALSNEPLSIEQLDIAISTLGRKPGNENRIWEISNTLERLGGPLIYIDSNSIVSFSHLSFRAFLLSGEANQLKTPFRVDVKGGALRIAVVCLSYLANSIPHGPLSTASSIDADRLDIGARLPLSEYSARYWVSHAVSALRLMPDTLNELMADCYPLLQQLGIFISRKAALSTWIELCWMYGFPPSIETLWHEFGSRVEHVDAGVQRTSLQWRISESLSHIRKFSDNLKRLDKEWSHLLSLRPYEIWGASISAFLGRVQWAHNDEAKVTVITANGVNEDSEDIILKVSKLSACGGFLGIVRVFRLNAWTDSKSSLPTDHGKRQKFSEHDPSRVDFRDTAASYQILQIRPEFPIFRQYAIPLDEEDLRRVEKGAVGSSFRFPIAFAPNLQSISILQTLFWFGEDGSLFQQKIDTPIFAVEPPTNIPPTTPSKAGGKRKRKAIKEYLEMKKATEREKARKMATKSFHSLFYKVKFSPCGQYVASAQLQNDNNRNPEGRWRFNIWKRESQESQTSPWMVIATLWDIWGNFLHDGSLVLNPKFEIIAFVEIKSYSTNQTSIWKFGTSIKPIKHDSIMVYADPLLNLHFSPCGSYVIGDHVCFKTVRAVHLERHLFDAVHIDLPTPHVADCPGPQDRESRDISEDGIDSVPKPSSTHLTAASQDRPNIQATNTLTLATRNQVPELSTIRRYGDGAVVLKRLSPHAETEDCLLYLPHRTAPLTTINVLDDKEDVRMVLTTDLQGSYTWNNPLNQQSARIITRPSHSIQPYQLPMARHYKLLYPPGELSGTPSDLRKTFL